MFNLRPRGHDLSLPSVRKVLVKNIVSLRELFLSTNSLYCFCFHWICLTFIDCLILTVCAILLPWVCSLFCLFCVLVIQCGCHWSQLKATYLLTYKFADDSTRSIVISATECDSAVRWARSFSGACCITTTLPVCLYWRHHSPIEMAVLRALCDVPTSVGVQVTLGHYSRHTGSVGAVFDCVDH